MNKQRFIKTVLIVIIIGCFGYFAFYLINAKISDLASNNLSGIKKEDVGFDTDRDSVLKVESEHYVISKEDKVLSEYKNLYLKNENLIGWLKIDDTNIDYPVMQSLNGSGDYYLNHDFDGNEDRNGTLFLDDNCDVIDRSDNLIIYGHNMKSGQMFGGLTAYKSESFFESHKLVRFDTIYEKGMYEVAFVFQTKVYNEADITFKYYQFIEPNSKEEFESGVRQMKEMSLYDTGVDVEFGDKLISMSTCDYDETNGRFVVVAKKCE